MYQKLVFLVRFYHLWRRMTKQELTDSFLQRFQRFFGALSKDEFMASAINLFVSRKQVNQSDRQVLKGDFGEEGI